MLPFGLVVISFGISILKARALSRIDPADALTTDGEPPPPPPLPTNPILKLWVESKDTPLGLITIMLGKFVIVILVGATFFLSYEREQDRQEKGNSGKLTFIDAAFFSTVISTTVGYGHRLVPFTDAAKGFLIFYFFFSTTIVGGIIGDLSNMYLEKKNFEIEIAIIDSTIFVHKADLEGIGSISESDYILFKLRQLQLVDDRLLDMLGNRFDELDVKEDGFLTIGVEIPSAEQVAEMHSKSKDPAVVMDLWEGMRGRLLREAGMEVTTEEETARHQLKCMLAPKKSISNVHDFAWSRKLWAAAARNMFLLSIALTGAYILLGYFLLARTSQGHIGSVWSWYFLSATMSTVGLGDFAPRTQFTRGFAIILIPFGLVIIGLFMSFGSAYEKSKPAKFSPEVSMEDKKEEQFNSILQHIKESVAIIDADNDGQVSREELISAAALLDLSTDEAADMFDQLDTAGDGFLVFEKFSPPLTDLIGVRLLLLVVRLYIPIFVGALFFYLYSAEDQGLTFIDSMYFATVTCTSVGYGDIVPLSDSGRIFMTFYMLVSTILIGGVLGEFITLYVDEFIGEKIIYEIIDSMTYVHKCDVEDIGVVSEPDYVLFKLQQMQKVYRPTLRRLAERFKAVDANGNGSIVIGVEIPSAEQVVQLQEIVDKEGGTLVEVWTTRMLPQLLADATHNEVLEQAIKARAESHGRKKERNEEMGASKTTAIPFSAGAGDHSGGTSLDSVSILDMSRSSDKTGSVYHPNQVRGVELV